MFALKKVDHRPVVLLGLSFFFIQGAWTLSEIVTQTAFLKIVGVRFLPHVLFPLSTVCAMNGVSASVFLLNHFKKFLLNHVRGSENENKPVDLHCVCVALKVSSGFVNICC